MRKLPDSEAGTSSIARWHKSTNRNGVPGIRLVRSSTFQLQTPSIRRPSRMLPLPECPTSRNRSGEPTRRNQYFNVAKSHLRDGAECRARSCRWAFQILADAVRLIEKIVAAAQEARQAGQAPWIAHDPSRRGTTRLLDGQAREGRPLPEVGRAEAQLIGSSIHDQCREDGTVRRSVRSHGRRWFLPCFR